MTQKTTLSENQTKALQKSLIKFQKVNNSGIKQPLIYCNVYVPTKQDLKELRLIGKINLIKLPKNVFFVIHIKFKSHGNAYKLNDYKVRQLENEITRKTGLEVFCLKIKKNKYALCLLA